MYWFGILCGPACTLWFERAKFPTWEAACRAFQAGYTIRIRAKDALQLASALTQPDDEPVASYIARFERKLGNVDIKSHKDLVIDALFENIRPILLISGAHLRAAQLPWGELTRRLIELEWSLGGPAPARAQAGRRQEAHLASNEALAAGQGDSRKQVRTREEREAFKRFKDACAFPDANGCWICGKEDHRAAACPSRPEFDKQHPELALASQGKAKQT